MSCDCNTLVVGEAGPQGPQGLAGSNGTNVLMELMLLLRQVLVLFSLPWDPPSLFWL